MGVYLYRVPTKGRKMTTGEEVFPIKFIQKNSSWGNPDTGTDRMIEESLICYDFGQAAQVSRIKAGHCEWWDSNEERTEVIGYMLRDGNNRYRLVPEKLTQTLERAYAMVESEATVENNWHQCWGPWGDISLKWLHYEGVYRFQLERVKGLGKVANRTTVYSSEFSPPEETNYNHLVSIVHDHLKMLEMAASSFYLADQAAATAAQQQA